VGAVGFLTGDILHYGYVGDCGLAVFSEENNLKFQTKDQVAESLHHQEMEQIAKGKNWNHAKRLAYAHEHFRNHPSGKYYGTFSGEQGTKDYYQIGSQKIQKGDMAIFYSDGFAGYLESKEFLRIVREGDKQALDDFTAFKAMTSPVQFGTDRTIVSITFE
jgi:serine/threonine protein phosphatase PrpC